LKIQVFLHPLVIVLTIRGLKIYVLFMFDNPYFGIFLPIVLTIRGLKIYVLFMFDNPYFGIFLPIWYTVITKL